MTNTDAKAKTNTSARTNSTAELAPISIPISVPWQITLPQMFTKGRINANAKAMVPDLQAITRRPDVGGATEAPA